MSGDGSILVDAVWKQYRRGRRDDTIRGALSAAVRRVVGARTTEDDRTVWALRDVSFEVGAGRVLGIIGANGAGKSTMLKLLSRIIAPSRGSVAVRGRVGALVELAAGFHPDLTGRENVFLQGALMGMTRRDIVQRFDEIVDFADVLDFIDTPVKRYSSGMHARLGFSVAAHLSPDVLLVDEVLSVGDHKFQRRAFARLKEVVASGAAVVVISHQLERVVELADEAILLAEGSVIARGRPEECVAVYVEGSHQTDGGASVFPYELVSLATDAADTVVAGSTLPLVMQLYGTGDGDARDAVVGVRVWALPEERVICAANVRMAGVLLPTDGTITLHIALQMNVGPGLYRVQAVVWRASDGSEWWRGPSIVVRIVGSPLANGPVFLAPSFRLASD